jgi:hypothetical protein
MDNGKTRRDVYRRSLRTHAHQLISMGYQELNAGDLAD